MRSTDTRRELTPPNRGAELVPEEGPKLLARLAPSLDAPLLHILDAYPGRTFYHPYTFLEMFARRNMADGKVPHFYYKSDPYHADDRTKKEYAARAGVESEGLVHILAIQAISELKGLKIRLGRGPNAEVHTVLFDEVTSARKGITTPSGHLIFPDLTATIRTPQILKDQFKGVLYIEVASHHKVGEEKRRAYRSLPNGAVELELGNIRDDFEAREARLTALGQTPSQELLKSWVGEMKKRILAREWSVYLRDPCFRSRPGYGEESATVYPDIRLPVAEGAESVTAQGGEEVVRFSPPVPEVTLEEPVTARTVETSPVNSHIPPVTVEAAPIPQVVRERSLREYLGEILGWVRGWLGEGKRG